MVVATIVGACSLIEALFNFSLRDDHGLKMAVLMGL
jgi:hypothetical protein